jgi:hypothetical protein
LLEFEAFLLFAGINAASSPDLSRNRKSEAVLHIDGNGVNQALADKQVTI